MRACACAARVYPVPMSTVEARAEAGTRAGWPEVLDTPRARAAAFLFAAILWTIGCFHRSMWEDEFHSLYHARAGSVTELLARVRSDNHPPLSFLMQHASVRLIGESVFAMRLPSLLAGLGMLLVYLGLCRRLADPSARAIAPWLAVTSSYLFWIVITARMYVWLALATLGLLQSILDTVDGRRSRWWITLWVALGLHSHYHAFLYVALLALACLVVYLVSPGERTALRRCVLPALAGGALFVPWTLYAFLHQLGTGDPPTATHRGVDVWSESYAHFLFLYARAGGNLAHYCAALPGVLAGALLGISGVRRLAGQIRGSGPRLFPVAVLALAILGPSWTYLASVVHSRSGFHLKYLASYAMPQFLLLALGVPGALWKRVLAGFLLAAMLAVTVANTVSRGRQNIHGAVDFILEHTRPGDAVLVRPWWQHDIENSPTDYGWYAPRLARGRTGPAEVPLQNAADACAYSRVWLIHTSGYWRWVTRLMGDTFETLDTFPIDPEATVYLYSKPRAHGDVR